MVSSGVQLDVVRATSHEGSLATGPDAMAKDCEWAGQLGRPLNILNAEPQNGEELVRLSRELSHDAIVLPVPPTLKNLTGAAPADWLPYMVSHASYAVFVAVHPAIPREVVG